MFRSKSTTNYELKIYFHQKRSSVQTKINFKNNSQNILTQSSNFALSLFKSNFGQRLPLNVIGKDDFISRFCDFVALYLAVDQIKWLFHRR